MHWLPLTAGIIGMQALFLEILTKKCQKKSIIAKKSLFCHFLVKIFKNKALFKKRKKKKKREKTTSLLS